ncbi:Glucokinase regulatory protein-like [Oopsacas minuta]|uniref:Glucokinase regulatory protein-like n=1 Tax=Oopsacas minuta TaxID=111878 RepID=A0AAV7JU58_9METZ|nr:Glucokinase regulatory protein-like [Oopsacas minuta]
MATTPSLTPFTERSNDITKNIDIANAEQIFDLIHTANNETFHGNSDDPICNGILNKICIEQCALVAETIVKNIFTNPNGKIVLSGCGTSGRIGFMVTRAFNKILNNLSLPKYYEYLLAGDDRSLFISQEAKEDEWNVGSSELASLAKSYSRVIYFGITCGLSAPYVAGQLDYCLHNDKFIPVLLGFNPVELARKHTLHGLGKCFYDIAVEMKNSHIINPVLGAEPITGSSRMKGGTATKIILETIFIAAHLKAGHIPSNLSTKTYPEIVQYFFENIYYKAYQQYPVYKNQTISLIQSCGDSLIKKTPNKEDGHIYYVANGTFGVLGLIDASECPPTFGTDYNTIRGFLYNAYDALCNIEGDLEAKFGDLYAISWNRFELLFSSLNQCDTVILLISESDNLEYTKRVINEVKKLPCTMFGIIKEMSGNKPLIDLFDNCIEILNPKNLLSSSEILNVTGIDFYEEIILKWILNTITTGAHILQGKILENYMIDVQPTNFKLYNRLLEIVMRFSGASVEKCTNAIISAIYQDDDPTPYLSNDVTIHVSRAIGAKKVVAIAILIASRNLTVSIANKYLEDNPVIRNAISSYK